MPEYLVAASYAGVLGAWVLQWARARRNRSDAGRVMNPAYKAGALLEAASFAILAFSPAGTPAASLQWGAAALAVASAVFGIAAGHHLGSHFRVQAVVTAEHRLIVSGPYSVVRHPIYASLTGFLLAGAVLTARWLGLALALPVFFAGTEIRVRAEDKILRQRFGEEFERYAARVPAYLPGMR